MLPFISVVPNLGEGSAVCFHFIIQEGYKEPPNEREKRQRLLLPHPTPPPHSLSHSPFDRVSDTHAKLLGAGLHASSDHQSVTRLKYMQRAWDCGVRHGADKYGNILVQAVKQISRYTISVTVWWQSNRNYAPALRDSNTGQALNVSRFKI